MIQLIFGTAFILFVFCMLMEQRNQRKRREAQWDAEWKQKAQIQQERMDDMISGFLNGEMTTEKSYEIVDAELKVQDDQISAEQVQKALDDGFPFFRAIQMLISTKLHKDANLMKPLKARYFENSVIGESVQSWFNREINAISNNI